MRIMEQKFASAKGATHGRNHGCIADLFQLTVLPPGNLQFEGQPIEWTSLGANQKLWLRFR